MKKLAIASAILLGSLVGFVEAKPVICTMNTEGLTNNYVDEPVTIIDNGDNWEAYFSDGEHMVTTPKPMLPGKKDTINLYSQTESELFSKGRGKFKGYYGIRFFGDDKKVVTIKCPTVVI